jgi:EmrB/QacA subfamily drug resistance transporter
MTTVTPYAARLTKKRIILTTLCVMAGMFLAGLDGTVVATAMPTVILELKGLDRYAWVFSAFLLTETSTIPLWGKVADMKGRKMTFLAGLTIFLLGSALSGQARSMNELIAFRAVQGIGAGCILPVAQTIIGDLFTMEQRAKIQGIFTGVFALSSVVGPLIGGFLTDNLSWRWVFYVNLPVGVLVGILLATVLVEPVEDRTKRSIDWLGMATLVGCVSSILFALESGGRDYAWASPVIIGCFAVSVVLLFTFLAVERRAAEPMLPPGLFRTPALRAGAIASGLLGMTMFGVLSFLPLFAQTVLGVSATSAGQILTPLMLGLLFASLVGGRWVVRAGYRPATFAGMGSSLVGLALLTRLGIHSTRVEISVYMIFLGIGMGLVGVTGVLAAQNSVKRAQLGVATSSINFSRQMGGAVGVAIVGSVVNTGLVSRLNHAFPGANVSASSVFSPGAKQELSPGVLHAVRLAFAGALHQAFLACLVIGIVALLSSFLMPKGRAQDMRDQAQGEEERPVDAAAGVITAPETVEIERAINTATS